MLKYLRTAFAAGLWAASCVLGLTPAQAAVERVALVIGNGAYQMASELPNPPNDARAVAGALRDIGFEVLEGIDVERNDMEKLVRDFLRAAQGAKVALFFYAGHGMEVGGQNYLIPVDAALETPSDLSFETVEVNKLIDNLDDPNRANIIILDACRDNPLARSFRRKSGATRSVGSGLAAYSSVGTGMLVALATAPGQVALDGEGDNSPFTTGLLKHLRTPGLEVRQMLTRVRRDVLLSTGNEQQPWDNSSLLGDVFLAGGPQVALLDNNSTADKDSGALTAKQIEQQRQALREAEELRKAAAEELAKARQASEELAKARKEAEAEIEKQRSAALIPRNDPVEKAVPQNSRDRFAAVAISASDMRWWGAGYNYGTQQDAEQRALQECAKNANDCKVVQWVRNACLSLATGTNAYGHSWNEQIKAAEKDSVNWCRKYGKNCKVTYSVCSFAAN